MGLASPIAVAHPLNKAVQSRNASAVIISSIVCGLQSIAGVLLCSFPRAGFTFELSGPALFKDHVVW
jgi:hypothetical protein